MTDASSPPRTEAAEPNGVRDWWLRTLLVLQRPRAVFVALRDDGKESASDRSEPILAVIILAGMAGVLTTSTAAHLMDPDANALDPGVTAIWAFIFGGIYGTFVYWAFGAILYWAGRAFGSQGSYRRARNVLAFAAVPVALSLVVLWPVKLALYGGDWFRTGGRDTGSGGAAFDLLTYAFFLWSLTLLAIGMRSVHGWTWGRALAATGTALIAPVLLGAYFVTH